MGRNGVAKMADFGIAKVHGATNITETGTLKGKFSFMAPELFHGADADVQTDVFAFAATLFRLVCGVAPFYGRTEADTMRAVLYGQPARASSLVAGVPAEIDEWISRALEKDRNLRPKDLAEVCQLLEAHHGEKQTADVRTWVERALALPRPARTDWGEVAATRALSPARLATKPPSKPNRRKAAFVTTVATVGFFSIATATYFILRKPRPTPLIPPLAPVTMALPAPTKVEPAPAVVDPQPAPPTPVVPSKPAVVSPKKSPTPSPAKTAAVTRPRAKTGKLRVKVMPWAEAFVNGAHVGKTPFAPLTLAEGTHSVILVNNELRVRKQYQVKVTGGKETVLKVELDSSTP